MADIRIPEEEAQYWKDAYWNLIWNKDYAPAEIYPLLQEINQLRNLNHKQAGMLMGWENTLKQAVTFIEEAGLVEEFATWNEIQLERANKWLRSQLGLKASKWWDYE